MVQNNVVDDLVKVVDEINAMRSSNKSFGVERRFFVKALLYRIAGINVMLAKGLEAL